MSSATKTSSFALAAAAAALLAGCAATGESMDTMESKTASAEGKCFDVNSCKGHGACATANSACAGQNACKGQGWIKAMKSDCEAKGGRFES